jgi:16S rRNA (guanine527-N7)-methyltransferase
MSIERLVVAAAPLGVDLSAGQAAALHTYVGLILERAVPLGLVSQRDASRIYERHILDCLRAAPLIQPSDYAFDLGSGAGLPGLPLAIAVPESRFLLIESRGKAAGFLELAIETLRLPNAEVFPSRAEEAEEGADVVTARAFAPLRRAWPVAARLLRPGGRLIYFAGRRVEDVGKTTEGLEPPPERVELLAKIRPLVIMTRS